MAALEGSIQFLMKLSTELDILGPSSTIYIPLAGQPVYVINENKFLIGDGSNEWQNLNYTILSPFTLSIVLALNNKTGEQSIQSDNGLTALEVVNSYLKLTKISGSDVSIINLQAGEILQQIAGGNVYIKHELAGLRLLYDAINGHDFYGGVRINSETANRVPYLDSNKKLTASSITPTELGCLSGLGSSVQAQLDALTTGQFWKKAVRAATISAGTLATDFENGDTIDGVVLATNDRILIKDQAAGAENGIYVVNASGAPTRATDFDASADNIAGATVVVQEGATNAETKWTCSTNNPITIGVTALTFIDVGGTTYTAGTGLGLTGNQFNITDAELLAIISLTSAADKGMYFTGSGTASTFDLTSVARTLLSKSTTQLLIDYISQMTTLGDLTYGGASGTQTRLAGNTSVWRKKLTQTGNGSVSDVPVWVNDEIFIFLTTGDQTTTNDTATNITDLIIPVEANSRYTINGIVRLGCSSTGGVKLAADIPASATMYIAILGRGNTSATLVTTAITADATLMGAAVQTAAANYGILLNGEIATGANAGNIQLMFASGVSGQTSTINQQGTWIKITKIA